ncbi:MAG: hypothetical protein AAGI37_11515 [Planctomycetota bacterium]
MSDRLILALLLATALQVGCHPSPPIDQALHAKKTAAFNPQVSTQHQFRISYNEYPGQTRAQKDAFFLRIVLDHVDAPYATPRTLLVEADPNSISAGAAFLFDLSDEVYDATTAYERVYFTMRIDQQERDRRWSGPYGPKHPRIVELLKKEAGLLNCFKKARLSADIHAFLLDMYMAHGPLHQFDDEPFEIDWRSVALNIASLTRDGEPIRYSEGTIEIGESWSYYWVPIVVIHNKYISINGSGYGGLTITLDHKTGRVGTLWIDPN